MVDSVEINNKEGLPLPPVQHRTIASHSTPRRRSPRLGVGDQRRRKDKKHCRRRVLGFWVVGAQCHKIAGLMLTNEKTRQIREIDYMSLARERSKKREREIGEREKNWGSRFFFLFSFFSSLS